MGSKEHYGPDYRKYEEELKKSPPVKTLAELKKLQEDDQKNEKSQAQDKRMLESSWNTKLGEGNKGAEEQPKKHVVNQEALLAKARGIEASLAEENTRKNEEWKQDLKDELALEQQSRIVVSETGNKKEGNKTVVRKSWEETPEQTKIEGKEVFSQELEKIQGMPTTTERFRVLKAKEGFILIEEYLKRGGDNNFLLIGEVLEVIDRSKPTGPMSAWYKISRGRTCSRIAECMALGIKENANISTKGIRNFIEKSMGEASVPQKAIRKLSLELVSSLKKPGSDRRAISNKAESLISFLSGHTTYDRTLAQCAKILACAGVEFKNKDRDKNQIEDLTSLTRNKNVLRKTLSDIRRIESTTPEKQATMLNQLKSKFRLSGENFQKAIGQIDGLLEQSNIEQAENSEPYLALMAKSLRPILEPYVNGLSEEELKNQGLESIKEFYNECSDDTKIAENIKQKFPEILKTFETITKSKNDNILASQKVSPEKQSLGSKIFSGAKENLKLAGGIAGWSFLMLLLLFLWGTIWGVSKATGAGDILKDKRR